MRDMSFYEDDEEEGLFVDFVNVEEWIVVWRIWI